MSVPATRARLLDAGALLVALLGVWLALVPSRPVLPGEAPAWWWADLVAGLVGSAALLLRDRAPVALALALAVVGTPFTTLWLAGAVALFAVAARRPWTVAAAVGAVSLACAPATRLVRLSTPEATSWGTLGYAVVITVAVVAWGAAVRGRHQLMASLVERAERAEAEAGLRADAARAAERTRIAREMHDVLAHRLSLVSMHAAALAHRRDGGRAVGAAELDEALGVIRGGAQEALNDLRAILGVLRADGEEETGRSPQPTLADLDRLVEGVREAGGDVAVHDDLPGGPAAVPDECGRTLFRITQEALTNAARHAPGRPVEVRLRGRPGADVELTVTNPLPVPATTVPTTTVPTTTAGAGPGGAGLVGIAERVELAGGRLLSCGPEDDRFRVAVRVPWPADADRRQPAPVAP